MRPCRHIRSTLFVAQSCSWWTCASTWYLVGLTVDDAIRGGKCVASFRWCTLYIFFGYFFGTFIEIPRKSDGKRKDILMYVYEVYKDVYTSSLFWRQPTSIESTTKTHVPQRGWLKMKTRGWCSMMRETDGDFLTRLTNCTIVSCGLQVITVARPEQMHIIWLFGGPRQ